MLAESDFWRYSLRCYSFFGSLSVSDYNYDDPGDIQRKLERLNQIMNQPDWNPNDPNKKMYLSQCKCTHETRPYVFISPFSRSTRGRFAPPPHQYPI